MPTRMIRGSLLESTKYEQISNDAKLLFIHLMLVADDFGCVSVGTTFLRRRCFYDSPTNERIARLLGELLDMDLIRTYEVDRTCYGFIPRFRQRLYRATLKHPQPPESLYADDLDAREKFMEINEDSAKPPGVPRTNPGLPPPEVEVEVEKIKTLAQKPAQFEIFWKAYPRKRSKGDAEKAFNRIKPNELLMQDILQSIERAKTSEDWLKDGGKFIPYPGSWLRAKGWEDEERIEVGLHRPAAKPAVLVEMEKPVAASKSGRVAGLAELKAAIK
jgi:hypothetical protein